MRTVTETATMSMAVSRSRSVHARERGARLVAHDSTHEVRALQHDAERLQAAAREHFESREVTAARELLPVHDVRIVPFGERADRLEVILEDGDPDPGGVLRGGPRRSELVVVIVSAPELYLHEWVSFSTKDFPENRTAGDGDRVRPGDVFAAPPTEYVLEEAAPGWSGVAQKRTR